MGVLSQYSVYSKAASGNSVLPDGIPAYSELIDEYRKKVPSHWHIPQCDSIEWIFYLALGLYRMACIGHGVYARSLQGNASRGVETGVPMKEAVSVLAQQALKIIQKCQPSPGENISFDNTSDLYMGVQGFQMSTTAARLLSRLRLFNDNVAIPMETELISHFSNAIGAWPERGSRWIPHKNAELLSDTAKKLGLWNLWISKHFASSVKAMHPDWQWLYILPHGTGLSNLEYAYMAIESGRCLFTPDAINCAGISSKIIVLALLY